VLGHPARAGERDRARDRGAALAGSRRRGRAALRRVEGLRRADRRGAVRGGGPVIEAPPRPSPRPAPESPLPATPYVGLVPYGEEDAAFFFGRDEEKQIVTGNLRASRLTILYGASGVGKSSLLQAGVIHDLRRQVLANERGSDGRAPFAICSFSAWRDDP